MSKRCFPSNEHPIFAGLPVRKICGNGLGANLAVHVAGVLDDTRLPVVCIPDYCRNMADYADFVSQFHRLGPSDWPIVLIDLMGRGRSSNRKHMEAYSTPGDAQDVACIAAALGIQSAILIGQGHGGQVLMALGANHSSLVSASILIDASPITDTPGLVKMRDNLTLMGKLRGRDEFARAARQVFGNAYPGVTEEELNSFSLRTHELAKNGRVCAYYDPALLKRLEKIQFEDMFEAQWPLFNMLGFAPMMLMRTQLTDQLQRATFERMGALRSDAVQLVIPGQGSPALLSGEDEVGAIVDFVRNINETTPRRGIVSG